MIAEEPDRLRVAVERRRSIVADLDDRGRGIVRPCRTPRRRVVIVATSWFTVNLYIDGIGAPRSAARAVGTSVGLSNEAA